MCKKKRFSAATELVAELNLTIGQALTLLSGGRVAGRRLDDYRAYHHEDDRPYIMQYGQRRTYL